MSFFIGSQCGGPTQWAHNGPFTGHSLLPSRLTCSPFAVYIKRKNWSWHLNSSHDSGKWLYDVCLYIYIYIYIYVQLAGSTWHTCLEFSASLIVNLFLLKFFSSFTFLISSSRSDNLHNVMLKSNLQVQLVSSTPTTECKIWFWILLILQLKYCALNNFLIEKHNYLQYFVGIVMIMNLI